jgi:hypothetical protein
MGNDLSERHRAGKAIHCLVRGVRQEGFSAEDLVLGAQRDSRKARLEKTEQLQESRKKEKIVSADHLKAMISQEARS